MLMNEYYILIHTKYLEYKNSYIFLNVRKAHYCFLLDISRKRKRKKHLHKIFSGLHKKHCL